MNLSGRFRRISEAKAMSRNAGLSKAVQAGWNRYRYDHHVSRNLPSLCPTTPYHVQIETSRVCNLRCKMCEYSYMENKGIVMELDKFKTILAAFPSIMSVEITGIGEPFCNPEFLEIVRHAKDQGLIVGFVNNGNLMTEERMDALIDMRVDLVQFSVDAATKETHESIRRHSNFDRVTNRIATFSEKVRNSTKGVPTLHMNFTTSRENIHETVPFVGLAKRLGVTEVSFRYMVVFEGGEYGAEDMIDTLGPEYLARVGEEILAEAARLGVNAHLDPLFTGKNDEPRLCMRPWMDSYVDVFGNLYPCCLVTQRNHDMGRYVLGNLLKDRFEDIWNSETYQQLRTDMAHPTRIPPICDGCVMLKKKDGRVENSPVENELVQITTAAMDAARQSGAPSA